MPGCKVGNVGIACRLCKFALSGHQACPAVVQAKDTLQTFVSIPRCSYACDVAIEHAEEHPDAPLCLWDVLRKEIRCGVGLGCWKGRCWCG